MSTKPETKPSVTSTDGTEAAVIPAVAIPELKAVATKPSATESAEKFRATLEQMDNERTALAKSAIEQLKPGRPFDPVVVRQINKIETMKNRLIVSRFASLLRKSGPEVHAIVHQIINL